LPALPLRFVGAAPNVRCHHGDAADADETVTHVSNETTAMAPSASFKRIGILMT
jgi:hypothetical protein